MVHLTWQQEKVVETILYLATRDLRPPTIRELAMQLGCSSTTAFDHLEALERRGVLIRNKGRVLFVPEFRADWPLLAIGDPAQAVAVLLRARHCSIHFLVREDRLCCPRTVFPCRVPRDYVTDLNAVVSITAFMARNPARYSLSQEEIAALSLRLRGVPKVSFFSPAYGAECNGLLSHPLILNGQYCGLVKVESKFSAPDRAIQSNERPFTPADEEMLGQIIEYAAPVFRRAVPWIMERYADAEVSTEGWPYSENVEGEEPHEKACT